MLKSLLFTLKVNMLKSPYNITWRQTMGPNE